MTIDTKAVRLLRPPRTTIRDSLEIPRMINGLWQLAGGHDKEVDVASAASVMDSLIEVGLEAFDMADHYGDAELVVGYHNKSNGPQLTAFTKWCPPENGVKTFNNAEEAVDLALQPMQQKRLALLQYHAWDYTDTTWIHNLCHLRTLQERGKIDHIGLTNTDAAHLELLLNTGFDIATNQVPCSVIDRRLVRGRLNKLCLEHDVGILAYGTLLGGFLSEKWLDQPEPTNMDNLNWSLRKYLRFIKAGGGWEPFKAVLRALDVVARRHQVPISAVATRHVLDVPSVKAVIVGNRLSPQSNAYVVNNLLAFSFELDEEDRTLISNAQEGLTDLPGDLGDEYRRPPYLTASGDLSDHLEETGELRAVRMAIKDAKRVEYCTGSIWEPIAGYCRAVRTGNQIHVSGTTANSPVAELPNLGGNSAASQTVWSLDIIENALKALGSSMRDLVRTRIMVQNTEDCDAVSRAHGWRMRCEGILPANTLVVNSIIGDNMLVEIEAWAEVGSGNHGTFTIQA